MSRPLSLSPNNKLNKGLKDLSQEGFESCNKRLKYIRKHLSRKNSRKNNLTDCLNQMWINSDPLVQRD